MERELPVKYPNSWTPGKYLRRQKFIRKKDPKSEVIQPDTKMTEYVEYLVSKGLKAPKLGVGKFMTSNDLPYTGLIAQETIDSNECFIHLPRQLLLTTKTAFFSKCQIIFEENLHFYHKKFHHSWEDNILWTFLLHEYQKGRVSPWYHMITNLSRDIDYLVFWQDQELELLSDPDLIKKAKKGQQEYSTDYNNLQTILSRYPQIFSKETYSKENCQWIYVHLISRCFGNYFKYVTMVPFAEFLNHECTDVYYDFKFSENNPKKSNESVFSVPLRLPNSQIEDITTSEGSYHSDLDYSDEDYSYQLDFDSDLCNLRSIDIKQDIRYLSRDIEFWVYNNLDMGDNFTIFFAAQVFDRIRVCEASYIGDIRPYYDVNQEMSNIFAICKNYKNQVENIHKKVLKKRNWQVITQKVPRLEEEKKDPCLQTYEQEWEDDEFDYFVMKCSKTDQFEPGSQVYFCYGRLSNRMLLMRYGVALEHNKYDHLYIKEYFLDFLQQYQLINQKLMHWKNIPKYKKFKIKRTCFNIELILYLRALHWKLDPGNLKCLDSFYYATDSEIKIIQEAEEIYKKQYQLLFQTQYSTQTSNLDTQTSNYHVYFASVYRVERQRILEDHIKICQILKVILQKIYIKKETFKKATERVWGIEEEDDFRRYRVMLAQYFNNIFHKPHVVSQEGLLSKPLKQQFIEDYEKNKTIQGKKQRVSQQFVIKKIFLSEKEQIYDEITECPDYEPYPKPTWEQEEDLFQQFFHNSFQ